MKRCALQNIGPSAAPSVPGLVEILADERTSPLIVGAVLR